MAARLASIDGAISAPQDALIPVTDEGLLRGDGVFEVIRLYGGLPYALEAHWTRMQASAANLRLPLDVAALRADVDAVLAEAGPVDAALRVLVTRGGRRVVLLEELKELPDTVALATITFAPTRILDGIKSLSYGSNMLASRLAQEAGADEALLVTPHGRVLEGPTVSFFYALGGEDLFTPPLGDHILDSITRRLVIAVTGATERVTTRDDLPAMTEAFLGSTLREVHPVHAIDGAPLTAGAPGPATSRAAEQVRERIEAELAAAATA
jgi:branched-chain amino acid aminotransferase